AAGGFSQAATTLAGLAGGISGVHRLPQGAIPGGPVLRSADDWCAWPETSGHENRPATSYLSGFGSAPRRRPDLGRHHGYAAGTPAARSEILGMAALLADSPRCL